MSEALDAALPPVSMDERSSLITTLDKDHAAEVHSNDPQVDSQTQEDMDAAKKIKSHILFSACGHDFHYIELFFIFGCLFAGLVGIIDTMVYIPMWLVAIVGVASSFLALGHVWNFCTAKRLGMAADRLLKTTKEIRASNAEHKKNVDTLSANNKEMRKKLDDLRESRLVIGKSVVSIQGTQDKQKKILEDTEDILKQRRKFMADLDEITRIANENVSRHSKANLVDKVIYFLKKAAGADSILDPAEADHLKALIEEEGVSWTMDLAELFSEEITVQGATQAMESVLDEHFHNLTVTLEKMRKCDDEIRELEKKIADLAEKETGEQVRLSKKMMIDNFAHGGDN